MATSNTSRTGMPDPSIGPRLTAAEASLLTVPTIIYVGTVAGLPTPDASNIGKYGRVSDLFGEKTDLVLCSLYAGNYFWQPVRPLWPNTSAMTATTMTLYPLLTPSIIRITGAMGGNATLTLSKTKAWPGCSFEVNMAGTLGIYTLTIAGLALGATLALLTGATKRIYYDGSDYQVLS